MNGHRPHQQGRLLRRSDERLARRLGRRPKQSPVPARQPARLLERLPQAGQIHGVHAFASVAVSTSGSTRPGTRAGRFSGPTSMSNQGTGDPEITQSRRNQKDPVTTTVLASHHTANRSNLRRTMRRWPVTGTIAVRGGHDDCQLRADGEAQPEPSEDVGQVANSPTTSRATARQATRLQRCR